MSFSTMFYFSTLLMVATLSMRMSQASAALTASQMAEIFLQYDVPEEDSPDCQPAVIDVDICPMDEKMPCGPIEDIVKYCKELLGDEMVAKYSGGDAGVVEKGSNVVEGCARYVGFHVFDHDHLACCDSDVCEDWLEEHFEAMSQSHEGDGEFYYEDDDDDEYDDVQENADHDDDDDDEYDDDKFGDEF